MLKRLVIMCTLLGLLATAGLAQAGAPLQVTRPIGTAPSWWTPQLRAQVAAAGPAGVPLPDEAKVTIPVSSLVFIGVRPGALILVDSAAGTSLCTTNFVFTSGTQNFIGTAGHCGKVGDTVSIVALPFGIATLGKIVKSQNPPEDRNGNFDPTKLDFALISVNPALNQWVSPSMAHWGGPTGVFTGSGVQAIQHSGWGLVAGTGGTPRAGLAYAWNVGAEYRFEGVVTPGDSGSGAIVAGGLAAGNITHIVVDTSQAVPVWNGGTTMTAILQYLGTSYHLATCSLPIPWPAPGCPPV